MTQTKRQIRRYGHVTHVTLIGGGELLVLAAELLAKRGYAAKVVIAPRHAAMNLPLTGGTLTHALAQQGIEICNAENINSWPELRDAIPHGANSLAVCFGPDWIFGAKVRAHFGAGMLNFNGIPVPRYLGGAHYTWQILNEDRSGGCVLQEIDEFVDRGPLLRRVLFEHAPDVRIPMDYFRSNFEAASSFLVEVIADLRTDKVFEAIPFSEFEENRLYFPRLLTSESGFIDWRWKASHIERFCCAFDRPYDGAASFLDEGRLLRLRSVSLDSTLGRFHSFAAGIIVRKLDAKIWVAAEDAAICVGDVRTADGADAMPLLREGQRLSTSATVLEGARSAKPAITSAARRGISGK